MGWSGLDVHETAVLEGQVGRVDEAVYGSGTRFDLLGSGSGMKAGRYGTTDRHGRKE